MKKTTLLTEPADLAAGKRILSLIVLLVIELMLVVKDQI
jgi:hypothetical protein